MLKDNVVISYTHIKGGRDFRKKCINNLVALRSSDLVQKQGT